MSNYVYGFFEKQNRLNVEIESIIERIRRDRVIGFHVVSCDQVPNVVGLPVLTEQICFCLSDGDETLLASELIFEADFAFEDDEESMPSRLEERVRLLSNQVAMILEHSGNTFMSLWISEVDQLEETAHVQLSDLFSVVKADFASRGIPCILYKISA